MAALDAIVLPALGPWHLLGLQSHLLEAVGAGRSAPVLLVHASAGRTVSLGRYHGWDGGPERNGIGAWRRLTGGRVAGSGEGWLGLALVLASRTAMLAERDARIAPEQMMNRYVRGLLAGLARLGLRASYPGRDAVTVGGREVAMCSFEVDASGATLFEALVAVNRGMEEVVHDLERFDPEGRLTCRAYSPDSASKLVRELDRDLGFDELARALVGGYASSFGDLRRRELAPVELAQAQYRGDAMERAGWLHGSVRQDDFNASARIGAQLGTIEARLKLSADGSIERCQLLGDFIANSSAIGRLESSLRGRPLDPRAVSNAVMQILGNGDNFVLGAGELSNLARLIARAQ